MTPTLSLMCGLPGSGKTTTAKRIEVETGAMRLCPDEWIERLELDHWDEPLRARCETRMVELATELLERGVSVVLEHGFWLRRERVAALDAGHSAGAVVVLHFHDVPFEERWRRIERRNAAARFGDVRITRAQLLDMEPFFESPVPQEARFDEVVRVR